MTLHNLCVSVAEKWPFDEATYPDLRGATPQTAFRFAFEHIVFHLITHLGNLARVPEKLDHGESAPEFAEEIRGMLVCVLRLAEAAGISALQLEEMVNAWVVLRKKDTA